MDRRRKEKERERKRASRQSQTAEIPQQPENNGGLMSTSQESSTRHSVSHGVTHTFQSQSRKLPQSAAQTSKGEKPQQPANTDGLMSTSRERATRPSVSHCVTHTFQSQSRKPPTSDAQTAEIPQQPENNGGLMSTSQESSTRHSVSHGVTHTFQSQSRKLPQSAAQTSQGEKPQQPANTDGLMSTSRERATRPSVSHCVTHTFQSQSRKPPTSDAQICQAVDVHEHSFQGIQAEDVLDGELSIQMMDFVSRTLKLQFHDTAAMFAPSFLLGLQMSHRENKDIKVDRHIKSVQIHFVNNHYLVSSQYNGHLCVYDSLYNLQHLQSLHYQLKLLYGNVNINAVQYLVPQSQGATNLCGFFAIATAETLLRNCVPGSRFLDCSLMRSHLYRCLQDASIQPFPYCSVLQHRNDSLSRQTVLLPATHTLNLREYAHPVTEENSDDIQSKFVQSVEVREKDKLRKQKKRLNPDFKLKERESSNTSKRRRRTDPVAKEKDRSQTRTSMSKLRKDPIAKEKDRERTQKSMSKLRKDPTAKEKNREQAQNSMSKLRKDPTAKEKDRERTQKSMSKLRKDPTAKEKDRERTQKSMSKLRKDPTAKEKDRERTQKSMSTLRKDPNAKEKNREQAQKSMSKLRKDPTAKEKDRERTQKSMSKLRKDPTAKEKDRERTQKSMSKLRKDPTAKEKNREQAQKSMSKLRKDPTAKEKDRERTRKAMSKLRQDPTAKQKDREQSRKLMSQLRKDPNLNERDRERTRLSMQKRRSIDFVREIERNYMRNYIRKKRLDPVIRHRERVHKRDAPKFNIKCKKRVRRNLARKKHENELRRNRRRKTLEQNSNTIESAAALFRSKVAKGCKFICTCCNQVWFENSVVRAESVKCDDEQLKKSCFTGKKSFDNREWLCFTCSASIRKKRLPVLAYQNGMSFPNKVDALELNTLEERLVAPVNPFMQLRELPSGGQVSIKGNVVNVPSDNIQTVTTLPRRLDQSGTIPVKLKRRLRYKTHYMYENIRPEQCLDAVRYLLQKPLFREYVKGVDPQWLSAVSAQEHNSEWREFVKDFSSDSNVDSSAPDTCNVATSTAHLSEDPLTCNVQAVPDSNSSPDFLRKQHMNDLNATNQQITESDEHNAYEKCSVDKQLQQTQDEDSDVWSEEDEKEEGPAGVFDTMLFDEVIDTDISKCISVAPSEGNLPMSGINPDLEELAFPTIFCGERRPNNKQRQRPVTYSEICKSELRRDDRRAAMSTANIFFKTKKLQYKLIQDRVWLSMKRLQSKGKKLTVADLKNSDTVEQLVRLDEGYRIFRTLRGSPPYWEAAKKDIFAMLRQLGKPTWFLTLSAAETKWSDLLQNLSLLVDNKVLKEEDIQNLSYNTKARLIRSDPVTTARYFHHRVQAFFTHFLLSAATPLGRVIDHFIRIEFQHRGSPHVHCLLWIENAPLHKTDEPPIVNGFIDNYITTCNSSEIPELIRRQTHRHSHTCKKKEKTCRFGIPVPPMQSTQILSPLTNTDILPHEMMRHKENWSNAAMAIADIKADSDLTFEDFLLSLGMTNDQYVLALRTTLKDDRVFLQRQPNATRINAYNSDILKIWEANMDLQYITDAYACAMYIISYISKGQRGMSDLLKRACSDAKKASSDIRQQVRSISDKFLRHVEISAQEAVFLTLQMPLRKSSRGFVFVNTSPAEERPFLLKSQEMLDALPDDSEDIKCSNVIQRYTERPKALDSMTLADFAAWYETSYSKIQKRPKTNHDLPEEEAKENLDDDFGTQEEEYVDKVKLTSGTIMKKRKQRKIIRYVRYSRKKDPENYYRESLMLFYPWRSESFIIGDCESYEDMYHKVCEDLEENRAGYEIKVDEIDQAEERLENEQRSDIWDAVAPSTEDQNLRDRQVDDNSDVDNEDIFTHYDIGADMGLPGTDTQEETIRNRMSDDEFRETIQNLNIKQREIFYYVLKSAKLSESQEFIFISGGAGVGKTKVVSAISQALIRHLNTAAGDNPEATSVLLVAPTGKAAYLINGQTIHSAFHIPANQGFNYKRLAHEMRNTLRARYDKLKFLIIDEISMVGSAMFNYINLRLQDLFQNTTPFGGVSIIAVGDLFQLRPVQDNWIFKLSHTDYSPLAPNVWTDNFKLYELTEIMRQRGDRQFAETLNRVREGCQTNEDIDLLKTRIMSENSENYPMNAVHIMYYNKSVDEHNNNVYDLSNSEKATVQADDTVIGDIPSDVKKQIMGKAPDKAKDAMGLGKYVRTAVGLRNELTVNIDTQDGMVNGASCVTKAFTRQQHNHRPCIIWVQFDHPNIGQKLRQQSRHLYRPGINFSWTPLKSISREFPVGRYKNGKILRRQFPIQMACAKTVHRSQGDTLSEAVLSLPTQKRSHLHYVAFSRVTSLENLHILGKFLPDKITVSKEVKEEMIRLRNEYQLDMELQIYQLPLTAFTVIFQNCQSLRRHIDDIRADPNFLASSIAMFVETKLAGVDQDDDVQLQNFHIFRNDFKAERSPYGSAVYYKKNFNFHCEVLNSGNIETTKLTLDHPVHLTIFCVYCRPRETISAVIEHINNLQHSLNSNQHNIIMGDFNINAGNDNTLGRTMARMGLRQLVTQPTTNGNTTIDHIYTDIDSGRIQSGVLETYYSYHKPIWLSLLL